MLLISNKILAKSITIASKHRHCDCNDLCARTILKCTKKITTRSNKTISIVKQNKKLQEQKKLIKKMTENKRKKESTQLINVIRP